MIYVQEIEGLEFFSNVKDKEIKTIKAICDTIDLKVIFTKPAFNVYGNELKDMSVMYIPKEHTERKIDEYFICQHLLSQKYKAVLREQGYPVDKLFIGEIYYLDCEKDYFPEEYAKRHGGKN